MVVNDPSNIRNYLFDLSKIVEGAASGDYAKVVAYVEQLSARLKAAGEVEVAKKVSGTLAGSKAKKFSLARANPTARSIATPVDTESRMPTADSEEPEQGRVPLFLSSEAKSEVDRFIQYLGAADKLIASGDGISPSMLIYGPPGCGKTQLARFIASELRLPILTGRTDGLISSYLGSTAKNLRALFEHAASRPCVLFLDEFDALAKMRDDGRELGELKRVVISLLQNIDSLGRDHVLIAATNHEHLLDPAIWRRFAFHLHLSEPDVSAREGILRQFLTTFADDEDVRVLREISSGLTGSQIRQIAEDSIRDAILSGRKSIQIGKAVELMLRLGMPNSAGSSLSLSDKVKSISSRAKLSQKNLAQIFNVTQPRISQILKQGGADDGG